MIKINDEFVRIRLAEKGWTKRELAQHCDVSEPTVYNVLRGKPFNSDTLGELAAALDCHPIDLILAEGFVSPHVDAPISAGQYA